MSSVIKVSAIDYPESDGKPMGETDVHRDAMFRHIELLKYHFRDQKAYVSGDLLVYYEQGNPKKFIVPDAFVAKGVRPVNRRVYKIWVEGKAPDAVIETTSRKTKKKDTNVKPLLYAQLGVPEYFMYDPTQDYLDPPLQGYRLENQEYARIDPDGDGFLISEQLGLRLKIDDGQLGFWNVESGEKLRTSEERAAIVSEAYQKEARAHQEEILARQKEVEARQAAEIELERLREELKRRDSGRE